MWTYQNSKILKLHFLFLMQVNVVGINNILINKILINFTILFK